MPLDSTDWDLSCPDWAQRLQEGRSLVPHLPHLDEALARRAVAIFNKLRLYDVIGTPPMGEVAGDWWRDIMRALFGSLDPVTGARLIRGLFCLVPKKNAKTTNAAGLMLTALIMNQRPAAEMLLTGPSQEISDKAFNTVRGMINNDAVLLKRFHVANHIKTITDRKNDALLKVKTFDEDIVTGAVVAAAAIDEIHLLGRNARAAWIIQQIRGGMVTIPEAFFAMITTQSFTPPAGVFRDELKIARAIRDGTVKGVDTLPVLYEFTEAQQKDRTFWENPDNWHLVTPNLNRSIRIPRLIKDFAEAKLKDEKDVRIWASQHLNIEIGLALHSERWRGADYWERAVEAGLTLQEVLRRSEVVTMGGDGGGLDDLLGLAVLGREKGTRKWLLWVHAWCHRSVLELRQSEAPRFLEFEKNGDLTIVDELGDDMDEVTDIVAEVVASGKLPKDKAVGVDMAGLGGLLDAIIQGGVLQEQINGISQGWRLSGAIMTTERALADGTLKHSGQRIMDYCVGNAKVEPRGSAKLITKQGSGVGKIDPLMATFDAVSLMSMNPQSPGLSFWDKAEA